MTYDLKKILLIVIMVIIPFIYSCQVFLSSKYVDAVYFTSSKGNRMIISTPVKIEDETWFLPIDFKESPPNCKGLDPLVGGVSVTVRNDIITIRAFTVLSAKFNGTGVNLGKLSDGIYQLQYLNCDDSTTDLGKIEIKNSIPAAKFTPLR